MHSALVVCLPTPLPPNDVFLTPRQVAQSFARREHDNLNSICLIWNTNLARSRFCASSQPAVNKPLVEWSRGFDPFMNHAHTKDL